MIETVITTILDFSQHNELAQMWLLLVVVLIVTWILRMLKQPIVIGYILAWIVVGPFALGLVWAEEHGFVELFSHLGIALLLFMVWLGLNPKVIKEHGSTALWVGIVQILWTAWLWFLIARLLWFDIITAWYIAAWLTFSSTIVIIKLLSDKEEQETLYGKIALWVLIIQDIVVMLLLMWISIIWWSGEWWLGNMLWGWIGLIGWVIILSKRVLPHILKRFSDMQEYVLLMWIGWCVLLGSLFGYLWFSFEIWSLIAWMSFAVSPYRREMANRLKSLRDFFLVLFFIYIGMQLEFAAVVEHIRKILILSAFVILIKPGLIFASMKIKWFTNKSALKSAMSLGQISEFSFLLIGIGIAAWHIQDQTLLSVVMFVWLITIFVSSYMTMYNGKLYALWKRIFGEHDPVAHVSKDLSWKTFDVLLFGHGRMWSHLADILQRNKLSYLVVDHDPRIISHLESQRIPCIYGDATNEELYQEFLTPEVRMVLSTVRDIDDDRELITDVKRLSPSTMVIVASNHGEHALELYTHGADYVIMPDFISADYTWRMLEEIQFDLQALLARKEKHMVLIEEKIILQS